MIDEFWVYWVLMLVWEESARRADKRAREECAEICQTLKKVYASDQHTSPREASFLVAACDDLENAIRVTIKEE